MTARGAMKRIMQAVFVGLACPWALLCGFGHLSRVYASLAQLFALLPGLPGEYWRAAFYRLTLGEFSLDSVVAFGTYFSRRDARVGSHVAIGSYCVIGRARIGARTQIASHVQIPSGRSQHARDRQGRLGNAAAEEVVIGEDCWIGASAVVMANVGSGSTVGAGSVVVRPIPEGAVAAGNPARVLGESAARDAAAGDVRQ